MLGKISFDQVVNACSQNGLRFTSSRQEIMSVLINSSKPKSAYQILEKIQKNSLQITILQVQSKMNLMLMFLKLN